MCSCTQVLTTHKLIDACTIPIENCLFCFVNGLKGWKAGAPKHIKNKTSIENAWQQTHQKHKTIVSNEENWVESVAAANAVKMCAQVEPMNKEPCGLSSYCFLIIKYMNNSTAWILECDWNWMNKAHRQWDLRSLNSANRLYTKRFGVSSVRRAVFFYLFSYSCSVRSFSVCVAMKIPHYACRMRNFFPIAHSLIALLLALSFGSLSMHIDFIYKLYCIQRHTATIDRNCIGFDACLELFEWEPFALVFFFHPDDLIKCRCE